MVLSQVVWTAKSLLPDDFLRYLIVMVEVDRYNNLDLVDYKRSDDIVFRAQQKSACCFSSSRSQKS